MFQLPKDQQPWRLLLQRGKVLPQGLRVAVQGAQWLSNRLPQGIERTGVPVVRMGKKIDHMSRFFAASFIRKWSVQVFDPKTFSKEVTKSFETIFPLHKDSQKMFVLNSFLILE